MTRPTIKSLTEQLATNDKFITCFIDKAEETEQHLNDKNDKLEDTVTDLIEEIEFLRQTINRLTSFAAGDPS